jgi:hypothetical protein
MIIIEPEFIHTVFLDREPYIVQYPTFSHSASSSNVILSLHIDYFELEFALHFLT